jgi:hypothetical protein
MAPRKTRGPPDKLPPITGIFEVCIGVSSAKDLRDVCDYYGQFGFSAPVNAGAAAGSVCSDLYGTDSSVTSVRLPHQDADHGLLRIMHWKKPRNSGVGAGPLKNGVGSRWAAALSKDVYSIAHHAQQNWMFDGDGRTDLDVSSGVLKSTSRTMYSVSPFATSLSEGQPGDTLAPGAPHVHEMLLSRAQTGKQIIFMRTGYSVPTYGNVNSRSHFQTSQFTHCGLMLSAPDETAAKRALDFYANVLGLLHTQTQKFVHGPGTKAMFDATGGTLFVLIVVSCESVITLPLCTNLSVGLLLLISY